MRRLTVLLGVLSLFLLLTITPVQASVVTLRMAVFKPDGAGGWTALNCGSGSVSVNGVGNIRVEGFAKFSGTTPKTDAFIRTNYGFPDPPGPHDLWYTESNPVIPANNVEILVTDTVQDLKPGVQHLIISGGPQVSCDITATNVPNPDEAQKSDRTAYVNSVTSLRWEIRVYGSNVFIPCGSSTPTPRVTFALFATAPITGDYDFHIHQEVPPASGTFGPDQHPPATDFRFWEQGFDHIHLVAGVERDVQRTTAAPTFGPGTVTFHGMQQHSVAQSNFVEVFCTITIT